MIKTRGIYEYSLRSGSRKDVCPGCGRRTFTPYVDERGEALSPEVGMCDRKNKCNYHYSPSDYRKDYGWKNNGNPGVGPETHGKGVGHFIRRSFARKPCRNYARREREEYEKPDYIPSEIFRKSLDRGIRNSLTEFLRRFFGKFGMEGALDKILSLYCVANSKKFGGSPLFWQIDEHGKVRDGKIMGYDSTTGKRVKRPHPLVTHVHTLLERDSGVETGKYQGCMFGSHIIGTDMYKDRPLWVFESEKAALIVATFLMSGGCMLGIPVATGGCGTLNPTASNLRDPYHRLRLLKGRKVVLFPDEGKYDEWLEKGTMLRGYAREVYVSDVMESGISGIEIQPGDALDDLLMGMLESGEDVYGFLTRSY